MNTWCQWTNNFSGSLFSPLFLDTHIFQCIVVHLPHGAHFFQCPFLPRAVEMWGSVGEGVGKCVGGGVEKCEV